MRRRLVVGASLSLAVGSALGADAANLSSAHYRIIGSTLNGGGAVAMTSTAPVPKIAAASVSAGQSEALGFSGSVATLATLAPGFWPIAGGGFPTLDSDLDHIQAFRDNCPFAYNPTQSDTGGILSLIPDGIGDACQCGDVNDDGVVDGADVLAFRGSLASPSGLPLLPQGYAKCTVIETPGPCDVLDVVVTRRALAPVPYLPGIDQVCAAASPP